MRKSYYKNRHKLTHYYMAMDINKDMRRINGFTLVELMVGLTVGLFVSLAAVAIFVSTRSLQNVSSSETRMSENARLAMDLLEKDLRSAGFVGCRSLLADAPVSLLTQGGTRFLDTISDPAGIRGSHGSADTFVPELNSTLAALAPNTNSDFISVRVPVEPMSLGLSVPMVLTTGAPQVGLNTVGNTILPADIILIANCKAAAIFQVTEANPIVTGNLAHVVGTGFDPGNSTNDMMQIFRGDSAVYRLQTHHYYIASGSHYGTSSMWRLVFPNSSGRGIPEEIAQGIDRMVITYGINDGNQSINKYVQADAVNDWRNVMAVRVQLLTSTVKDGVSLGNQAASFAGSTIFATDHRLRYQITQVVTLRNNAP